MKTVWAFDIGKGSLGEAVRDRDTNQFLQVNSWIIPPDFASTKPAASRRRMKRTRDAHKAREAWLDRVWCEIGLDPLRRDKIAKNHSTGQWELVQQADPRLKREFSEPGDDTCYTSCLLRIKLLQGEDLAPWQIFKALFSAIQRRGYDPEIPWKTRIDSKKEKDEEGEIRTRMAKFNKTLAELPEDYRLPCYYQAWKMGLWSPEAPKELKLRITHDARSIRNVVMPRDLVVKELELLIAAAAKQIPALVGKERYLLWGPGEKPYASADAALRQRLGLRLGGETDHYSLLGQKIPRFDNRIIEKCLLIPRFNVCKVRDDLKHEKFRLVFEIIFLLRLKNMRVQAGDGEERGLTAQEIAAIFEETKSFKAAKDFKITKAAWRKRCEKLGVRPLPNHEEVTPPRVGGRSRFSRPALKLVKELILSGLSPKEFHAKMLGLIAGNTDPKKGLVKEDLDFLSKMGESWEKFHIPDQKIEVLLQRASDREAAVRKLIGSQNDPIVRHRLETFYNRIKELEKCFGEPEAVALEFVREDFMGEKALKEYQNYLKKREAARKRARDNAEKAGATARSAALKMELFEEQGGICLYTGESLSCTDIESYEIEHIVPRSLGGPDAMFNYVLTTRTANANKGEQTPYQWLHATDQWVNYLERIRSRGNTLPAKKVRLLTQADAVELVDRYTALAETAWVAKLSRAILDLHFGWKLGVDAKGEMRIRVINGGLTARIRRKYRLNSLLAGENFTEEDAEKKNRDDHRHHALDAMVISFIPGWARNAQKEAFFRFPEGVDRTAFATVLKHVFPKNLFFAKPTLAETIYGIRGRGKNATIVKRVSVVDMAYKADLGGKKKYEPTRAEGRIAKIRDTLIQERLRAFIATSPTEEQWKAFCANFRQQGKDGCPGSLISHVRISEGSPEFYKDLAKTKPGQPGSSAWRTDVKESKGQFVYLDEKKVPRVRAVRVYESRRDVEAELKEKGDSIIDFFQSGCLVELSKPVVHGNIIFPAGLYALRSIRSDARVELSDISGRKYPKKNLRSFLEAGFRRPRE